MTLLLSRAESFAGDGVGNAGNDAGGTRCRRYMQMQGDRTLDLVRNLHPRAELVPKSAPPHPFRAPVGRILRMRLHVRHHRWRSELPLYEYNVVVQDGGLLAAARRRQPAPAPAPRATGRIAALLFPATDTALWSHARCHARHTMANVRSHLVCPEH